MVIVALVVSVAVVVREILVNVAVDMMIYACVINAVPLELVHVVLPVSVVNQENVVMMFVVMMVL